MTPVQLRFRPQPEPETLLANLSGLAFDGTFLWAAGDETNDGHNTLERLTWDAAAGAFADHRRFRLDDFVDLPGKETGEADLEGLAVGGGYLWFTGSHARNLRKPKKGESDEANLDRLRFAEAGTEPNRFALGRIPLEKGELVRQAGPRSAAVVGFGPGPTNLVADALRADPHLGPFLAANVPGKANGFDVEGLAYLNGRLFLGLRGPVLMKYAFLIEVEPHDGAGTEPGRLGLKKIGANGANYRKHAVDLGGRGVRDLCRHGDDLLILSGPTMSLDAPAGVHRLADAGHLPDDKFHAPTFVRGLPSTVPDTQGRAADQAEGMTLVTAGGAGPQLLVVYDTPDPARRSKPGADAPFSVGDLFDL